MSGSPALEAGLRFPSPQNAYCIMVQLKGVLHRGLHSAPVALQAAVFPVSQTP